MGEPPFPHHSCTLSVVSHHTVSANRYGAFAVLDYRGLNHWYFEEETGRDLFEAEHSEHVRRVA